MKPRNHIALFFFTLSAMAATSASATQTFCVDTVGEFNTAYATADEENVVIRVVRGTYNMTGSCIDAATPCDVDDDVTIRGGYEPGCGSRTLSAVDTVFTRPGGGLVIDTSGSAMSGNGDVLLESLTFRNVPSGMGIVTESQLLPDAYVSLRRIWFDQTGGLHVYRTADVAVQQSLFSATTAACALRIENMPPGSYPYLESATIQHVTIAGSSGDGLCIGGVDSEGWSLALMNSIAWDNDGDDIVLDAKSGEPIEAHIYNNTYATLVSGALSMSPSGTLGSNPQFVNPAAGDFELGGTSASINSAFPQTNVDNEFDLKGDPRRFSIAADRGALESPVGSTAATLVVTNTADAGLGSLRQAILDANQSPNVNRIEFAISSSCGPRVINLASNLPGILYPVKIDGYTQPGASRNSQLSGSNGQLCIILQQGAGSSAFQGLSISGSAAADMQLQVDGLGFSNFLVAGISLGAGNGHTVLGSQFGGSIGAVNLSPSGYGVRVYYEAVGVQIGGPEPSDRNVFVDALEGAISLTGGLGVYSRLGLVQNNYIGLAADGITPGPNGFGISIHGSDNRIIDNVISANDEVGIDISGSNAKHNRIENNVFGRPAVLCFPATCNRGNGSHGVLIRDGAVTTTVRGNTFANNGGDGVAVVAANRHKISANSFFDNVGEGIDLGNDGFTPNDNDAAAPPSSAGNVNQNYPLLSVATGTVASGVASGTLASVNGSYLIEFYATDSCGAFLNLGEGRYPIGSQIVTINNALAGQNGSVAFSNVTLLRPGDRVFFQQPRWVMATATRYSTGNYWQTSEFGPCIPYVTGDVLFANGFDSTD